MRDFDFDVFLSHSSRDKPFVTQLATRLQQHGIRPFLDSWNLVPGALWETELEAAMKSCATAAIIFGPYGNGAWQEGEMQVLLNRSQRERGEFRVIPVLLEGANPDSVLSFLQLRTWVDFGKDDFETAFSRLLAGIRGEPPENASSVTLPDDPAPYRSLQHFGADNSKFFFGRDAEIVSIVRKLEQQPFLAVVGASGSGKSSLVRAGLATSIAVEALPVLATWKRLTVLPGSNPLRSLARELVHHTSDQRQDTSAFIDSLTTKYAHDDGAFLDSLFDEGDSWLVIIDQFEELLTHRTSPTTVQPEPRSDADAFIAVLKHTVEQGRNRVRVLLTVRTDFIHRCLDFPDLMDLFQDNQYLLGRMSRESLREAILRPASMVGALFEKGLVERILSDVEGQAASLPLLQHALYELWRCRRGQWLPHLAYEETGGVAGALRNRADATFAGLTERQQRIAKNIFLRLTSLGEGVSDTRRRASRSELYLADAEKSDVDTVLTLLSGERARLIEASDGSVEVTHEALIQQWPILREWLESNRTTLQIHRQLTRAASEWVESHVDLRKRDSALLYSGYRLSSARQFLVQADPELNHEELAFVEASVRTERRRRRSTSFLSAGLAAALVLSFVISGWTLANRVERRLNEQRLARSQLQTQLSSVESVFEHWADSQRNRTAIAVEMLRPDLMRFAKLPSVVNFDKAEIIDHDDLANLQKRVQSLSREYELAGFQLFDNSGRLIASDNDSAIGSMIPEKLLRATDWPEIFLSPGVGMDLQKTESFRAASPVVIATRMDSAEDDRSSMILSLIVDSRLSFRQVFQVARTGETGEAFAFDGEGRMLTSSRFCDQLREAGIISDNVWEDGTGISLRSPGKGIENLSDAEFWRDCPLITSVQSAIQNGSGIDMHGYFDYRGVMTVGAWNWLKQYECGIAVQMTADEALLYKRDDASWPYIFASVVGVGAVCGLLLLRRG